MYSKLVLTSGLLAGLAVAAPAPQISAAVSFWNIYAPPRQAADAGIDKIGRPLPTLVTRVRQTPTSFSPMALPVM